MSNFRRTLMMGSVNGLMVSNYLTFVAAEDATFKLSTNAVNYSLDNGKTWMELPSNTESPTITGGSSIMWKGTLTPNSSNGIGTFSATGNFEAKGNVMSLLFGNNFKGQVNLTGKDYAFYKLFNNNAKLTSADKLVLAATTLATSCYEQMFANCANLTIMPSILPATELADTCYYNMFQNCTSLNKAPKISATTLSTSCCGRMFYGCTSLTTAPTLLAVGLTNSCYNRMFRNCSNLNYVKAMFTTTPSSASTNEWLRSVAANGIFVKNIDATWDVIGVSGVPNGWTIIYYDQIDGKYYLDQNKEVECDDHGNVIN